MKQILTSLLILLISINLYSQSPKPKLVVGIVVDQMRYDYLQRFESRFSDGGFKRMMKDGFEAKNTHYNYIPTYTAPGHASIYTGTTPKYHGIIANTWYSRILSRSVYCVGDTLASNTGGSDKAGKISPRNLMVNTITDELKLSTNFLSKVIGVSIKDRGAVLPAGHTPDGAYWYDSSTGDFMTSDFYTQKLPKWVEAFNGRKLVDKYSSGVWETLYPIETYVQSTADHTPYEKGFKGKETPTFPYDLEKLRLINGPYDLIKSTPFGNSLVLDLAKAAIEGENLGQDNTVDFLSVSLSSTDYIGHNFSPNSIEIEDTYLRLDQDLAAFLAYLDNLLGESNYLVFLTADHGVVANPQFLTDHELPGGYIDFSEIETKVREYLKELCGAGNWLLDTSNDQLFLNRSQLKKAGYNLEQVQVELADLVAGSGPVMDVLTSSNLNRLDYSDPLRKLLQNGYNRKLSGDLLILMKPGYLADGYGKAGSSHGSGYTYDTHVPLLFFGAGVTSGRTVRKTTITDIAPTLSMLLNISIPNAAVTGEPIKELFE